MIKKMKAIDKNYIHKHKLPGASMIVMVNGIFQAELSDRATGIIFEQQTIIAPANTTITKPIHLLCFATKNCGYTMHIIAEKNSCFTLIEEYVAVENASYANNIKINIIVKDSSKVTYYKLQNETSTVSYTTQTIIEQEQNSSITSGFIGQGSKNSHELLEIKLMGEHASYNSIGIISLQDNQSLSYQARVEHLVPNCTSNILFKGVVADKAAGNFNCLVVVYPQATKAQTHVTNKNMLLADTATMNTSPQLEVYTDDIICTHGATVGQLDQEALFYLRSRGLAEDIATQLLINAFTQEIIDQFATVLQTKNKRILSAVRFSG